MKPSEIRELTLQELDERIETEREHLSSLRMAHAISPLENPMQLSWSKRTIARLLTIRTERLRSVQEQQ